MCAVGPIISEEAGTNPPSLFADSLPQELDGPNIQFPEKLQVLFQRIRYKVLYGGRGGTKSWGIARALLLEGYQTSLRILCVREFQASIADSVHKLLSDQIAALGLEGFYRIEKAAIYGANGTIFNFEGIRHNANKVKSYEGIDRCWVEEANKVTKSSWDILIPTIRKSGSEIWISFNPELEEDETYKRFIKDPPPNAAVVFLTYEDNPWFYDTEMPQEMENLQKKDFEAYENVWLGKPLITLKGAVFGKEMRAAALEGRIARVPYNPALPVETYWDLGYADMTTIWFRQRVGFEFHYIDYYQNQLEHLNHYLEVIQNKRYIYSCHHLPHDAAAHQLGSKMSIEERMRATHPVKVGKKLSLEDGIDAARTIFPICYFDEIRCADGLQALRHYQYEVVEQLGTLSRVPKHDWASHGADSFRYSAVGAKAPKNRKNQAELGPEGVGVEKRRSPMTRWAGETFTAALGWMQ